MTNLSQPKFYTERVDKAAKAKGLPFEASTPLRQIATECDRIRRVVHHDTQLLARDLVEHAAHVDERALYSAPVLATGRVSSVIEGSAALAGWVDALELACLSLGLDAGIKEKNP